MKKALEAVNALVLLVMFVITMTSVVFRVILEVPASWTEELAQYTLIFLTFIGAASVMRDEGHIAISVVIDRLGKRPRRAVLIFNRLLMVPFLAVLTLGAWENTRTNWTVGLPTADWMKIGYMYLIVSASGAIMIFYTLLNLCQDLFHRRPAAAERGGAA
jgi:TRAP-type C4-dicarboxylate transport system permease small subunit